MLDSVLESPIDLAFASVTEPGPGLLVATTRMTTVRAALAAVFALAALAFLVHAWSRRAEWYDVVWPHGVMIPVLSLVALVLGFGHQRKAFDRAARTLVSSARLGPLASSKSFPLPEKPVIKLTFTREQGSRASGKSTGSTRRYDLAVDGAPAASFTLATDQAGMRAFAARLAAAIGASVVDDADDDVERLKP